MHSQILMIEDEPAGAERTLAELSRIGIESVLWARDSAAGLRLMRNEGIVPSLLLLHHHVGASGAALLEEIHRDPELRRVPVLTIDDEGFHPEKLSEEQRLTMLQTVRRSGD